MDSTYVKSKLLNMGYMLLVIFPNLTSFVNSQKLAVHSFTFYEKDFHFQMS